MPGTRVRTGPELARIVRELKKMGDGKEIVKRFRSELRSASKPILPAVRTSIGNIPSKQQKHSLRKEMQRASTLSITTSGRSAGIVVRVDGRKMPDRKGSLPAYMEGTKKRWRHPVFGNRDNWVDQSKHPYFDPTMHKFVPVILRAIDKVVSEIAKDVT